MTLPTVAQPAVSELLALARAARPDWDHDVLADAILAAQQAGWPFDRILAETTRLLREADGTPWDLRRAAANPARRTEPDPEAWRRGAERARQLLGYDGDEAGQ